MSLICLKSSMSSMISDSSWPKRSARAASLVDQLPEVAAVGEAGELVGHRLLGDQLVQGDVLDGRRHLPRQVEEDLALRRGERLAPAGDGHHANVHRRIAHLSQRSRQGVGAALLARDDVVLSERVDLRRRGKVAHRVGGLPRLGLGSVATADGDRPVLRAAGSQRRLDDDLEQPSRSRPEANASPIRRTERSTSTCWRRSSCIWALRRSPILLNSRAKPAISSSPRTGTLRPKSPSPIPRAASNIDRTWRLSMRRSSHTAIKATAKNTTRVATVASLQVKKPPVSTGPSRVSRRFPGPGRSALAARTLSPSSSTSTKSPLDGRLTPFSGTVEETVPFSSTSAPPRPTSLARLRYSDAVVVEAVSDPRLPLGSASSSS